MLSFDSPSLDLQSEVRRLLSLVLRRPIGDAENPSRDTEPAWDSLKHVEIVFLMEDHFEVRFDGAEISSLKDAAGLVRLLEAQLAPQP
jgi:acyl carrier protein